MLTHGTSSGFFPASVRFDLRRQHLAQRLDAIKQSRSFYCLNADVSGVTVNCSLRDPALAAQGVQGR